MLGLKEILLHKLDENRMKSAELERKAGLSPTSIRKILSAESPNPTLETLMSIANVFQCSLDELVGNCVIRQHPPSEENISRNLKWNSHLMRDIFLSTCDYLEKYRLEKKFGEIITFIAETYNYCVLKKNGAFDREFHEWYIQQKLCLPL